MYVACETACFSSYKSSVTQLQKKYQYLLRLSFKTFINSYYSMKTLKNKVIYIGKLREIVLNFS
jgi:hypothetical protein